MIRDKIENREYFDSYIIKKNNSVEWFKKKLENGEVKEHRILPVKDAINSDRIKMLVARYSRGDSMIELRKEFLLIFDDFVEVSKSGETRSYSENLTFVSLTVLFDVEKSKLESLKSLNLYQDSLMNYLINGEMTNEIANEKLQIEDYKPLYEIIFMTDQMEQLERLQFFVNKVWYNANDEMGWYDSHKEKKLDIYNGYWCFEGAAVAKILEIPDNELKENQYYPYDLVHFTG